MAVITNFGVPVSGGTDGSTLMPKLQYRFRVTFTGLGGATKTAAAPLVTRNVVSVSRPSLEHEDVTVDAYNSKIRLLGKHTWQDIQLVLRDDLNSDVIQALGAQLNTQVNHATQSSARAGRNYKFGMRIEMLDGSYDAGDANVIDAWELAGCFIPSIQYGELNYSSSEMVQVTCTIRYDNAAHLVDDEDALSLIEIDATGRSGDNAATA